MEGGMKYGALSNPKYAWKCSTLLRKDMGFVLPSLVVRIGILVVSWKNMDTRPFSRILISKGVVAKLKIILSIFLREFPY